jgi:Arc/MetJ family transcription regulator
MRLAATASTRRQSIRGRPDNAYTCYTRDVYDRCMSKTRTNIEIEDTYVQSIMDRYGLRTKTEAVDLALRHLAGQPMTREEALDMRGAHAIGKMPTDAGPRRVS